MHAYPQPPADGFVLGAFFRAGLSRAGKGTIIYIQDAGITKQNCRVEANSESAQV